MTILMKTGRTMSAIYLKTEEFVPYAPESPGTVNIYHCKEGPGNDRLYITRSEDGNAILAYCHHCGKRGVYNVSALEAYKSRKKREDADYVVSHKGTRRLTLPKDYTGDIREFSAAAQLWLYKAGLTDEEIKHYALGYSPSLDRVILPVYKGGDLAMFQSRRVSKLDEGHKYKTYKLYDAPFIVDNRDYCHHLVIVEDILSAIRVGRTCSAHAMLGTGMKDKRINELRKLYKSVIIWMDDDNKEVKKAQLVLKNKLEMYFDPVWLVTGVGSDPKLLTDKEIKIVLDKTIKT